MEKNITRVLLGQSVQLSDVLKQQINTVYTKLFLGLVASNYANGKNTLGIARQRALEQLDGYIDTKTDKTNPIISYMSEIHAGAKKHWARENMLDKNANNILEPQMLQQYKEYGAKETKQALTQLNDFIEQHKQTNVEFASEKGKSINLYNIAIQQLLERKQRAA